MIAAFQDEEGLRIAAAELFEEAFEAPALQENARTARASEDENPLTPELRTLSPGYYLWIEFVLETIEQPLEAGVEFREASLLPEELLTLRVLRQARQDFRRKHPPCRGCGKLLRNEWDKTCNDCEAAAAAEARKRNR